MALSCGASFGADAPPFKVNPIATAPSASYGQANGGGDPTAGVSNDPRVRHLTEWLRANVTQAQAAPPAVPAGQPAAPADDAPQKAAAKLRKIAGESLVLRFRPENSTPLLIRGNLQPAVKGALAKGGAEDLEEQTARTFLREHRELLRIADPDLEFRLTENKKDELERHHLRFAQYYKNIPVFPCELMVHLDPQHNVDLVNGAYIPTPGRVDINPGINADQAKAAALAADPDYINGRFTEPDLIIYGPLDAPPRLAWRFEVHVTLTSAWRLIIDAQNSVVLSRISLVHDAAVSGSGVDAGGTSRPLNLWQDGANYYMVDTSKQMFDATSRPPNQGRGTIEIYDAANREVQDTQFSAGLIKSTNPNGGWDPDAVGAAFGLSQTYDYYLERFGRNSLNGIGGTIRALVRYGNNVANAFWYGTTKTMVFGAGFTRQIDISGHELTHGVIDSVGNGGILEYRNQSGALNEALADIFGEMVEARLKNGRPDWLKADPFDPTNHDKAIQDYANPRSVAQIPGQPNPSKMSEFIRLTIDQDNGGVHINSSIINHCFYLLAEGLDGAIGLRDAEKVFYRAMTTQLQKQSQFIDMRLACVTSADELFGADSTQARKTREAFDRVEIFDAPDTPTPTPIPTIDAPDSTLFLRYEPFFGGIILCRREQALGDSVQGTLLDTVDFVAAKRISITGDGSFAVFVTGDHDIGFIRTDGLNVSFAELAGEIHSVAMAPMGTRFAVVLRNPFTGTPDNEIILVDLANSSEEAVKLLAPVADGAAQDIVKFADSMDFLPDGNTLIYDAISEIPLAGGSTFEGWNLFAIDLTTKKISTIINLNDGFDFGNPSLGNSRNYLLTHEVIDKATGISTIFTADLRTGEFKAIATLSQGGVSGLPAYTGDDRAIIYTQVDMSVPTTVSLLRQELAEDGITPVGQPTIWVRDADFAAIYRRGTYVAENALPQVALTSPTPGQNFPVPATITLSANASDADGSVARVAFYVGSTMIAEDSSAPYSITVTVESAPANGAMRFTARAIDNLGGQADTEPVEVKIGGGQNTPITITIQPQSQTVQEGATATFTVAATGGAAPLTYQWRRNGTNLGVTGTTLQLSNVVLGAAGDYSVQVSDGIQTVTSATATLTVTPRTPTSDVRLQGRMLPGNLFQLTITGGKLNDIFRVQTSQDLKTWTTIATLVKASETVTSIDAESSAHQARYYRVMIGN